MLARGSRPETNRLEEELLQLAESDPTEFHMVFRQARDRHPKEMTRACLRHLAAHGPETIWQKTQFWIIGKSPYLKVLLEPDFLDTQTVARVGSVLCKTDHQFFLNLQAEIKKGVHSLRVPKLERIMYLCESLGNTDILLSWLRTLTSHPDEYVRSRSAKALCFLRPNLAAIERQLRSEDSRVRANAIEVLWGIDHPDAIRLFKAALSDSSHRVVVNALLGLHRMKVPGALERLIECGNETSPLMRRAAIWGMKVTADPKCLPALQQLARDPVAEVREKALEALSEMHVELESASVSVPEASIPGTLPTNVPAVAPPADTLTFKTSSILGL